MGRAIQRLLQKQHDVVSVTRGRDALDRLHAGERFDVIFCDLMMPEMTGMELHAELLKRDPVLATQLVFISGGAFSERARVFLEEMPNLRLEKPLDAPALRAVIDARLRSAREHGAS